MYLFSCFLPPSVKNFFFFFTLLCSDSHLLDTLIHFKACTQKWEQGNNKLAELMAFSLNNLGLGCRFCKTFTC